MPWTLRRKSTVGTEEHDESDDVVEDDGAITSSPRTLRSSRASERASTVQGHEDPSSPCKKKPDADPIHLELGTTVRETNEDAIFTSFGKATKPSVKSNFYFISSLSLLFLFEVLLLFLFFQLKCFCSLSLSRTAELRGNAGLSSRHGSSTRTETPLRQCSRSSIRARRSGREQ